MNRPESAPEPMKAGPYCPWEHFDAEWYAANAMRRLSDGEPTDPLAHYTAIGVRRQASPNPYFDEAWYLTNYPDVRDAVAQRLFASGFEHYCIKGHLNRDPHWLFSDNIYRARRGDLDAADLATNGLRNGYHHFLIAGQNEGTSGSTFFDPALLRESTGIEDAPFTTLLTAPWLGNLQLSQYFDPEWYLAMHEEVDDLIADEVYLSPLHHYLTNPTPARYAGSPDFDEAFYAARYTDIRDAVRTGAMRTGYQHFVDHGRFEDRQPSPWFDPLVYRAHRSVKAALARDRDLTAFDHYQRTGRRTGLPTLRAPHTQPPEHRPGTEAAGKDIFLRMAHFWATTGQSTLLRFDPAPAPDISVVMCAFNQFDLTMQTLLHLSGSHGVSFEVILVDNASVDATGEIERRVQGMTVLRQDTNLGFLHASNLGIAEARGRHVLLLNNDVIVPPNALALAMARLDGDATVGAVGGKILRTHGQLQEAGCILFSNGSALGYGRDRDPFDPEFDFVREVDFCSGVFLMLPRAVIEELGGLDTDYAPAYYEETDLCVRVWKSGRRVIYDPAIAIIHLEFGSSRNPDAPRALMRRNRETLLGKHRDWLVDKLAPDVRQAVFGRSARPRRRVLFVEDTIPYRHIGSGFVRSADVVASLVALGCDVTVLPMNPMEHFPADRRQGFDETVELLWDHDITDVPALFAERATFYDVVWVCRAHNLHRMASVLQQSWGPLGHGRLVLDTEALAFNRDAALAALEGRSFDIDRALRRELRPAFLARDICCVNRTEQAQLIAAGLPQVHMLGHTVELRPTPRAFDARRDILALGSLYGPDTPNVDGLRWFIDKVWPIVRLRLPSVRLVIAGYVKDGFDAEATLSGPMIEHLGFVPESWPLYDRARVFLAPTRFSAGIPFKVHEAAAHGVPVMGTALLAAQLGWQDGIDLMACPPVDPHAFAEALVRLYTDHALWQSVREAALLRIETECRAAVFTAGIAAILGLPTPAPKPGRTAPDWSAGTDT